MSNEKKNMKTLIIGDVHCRDFWKEPVKEALNNEGTNIVFLGDYLDGYPHEWSDIMDGDELIDYRRHGIENFKEIIELKKKYPSRIILLLGNHDSYIWADKGGSEICDCRHDYKNMPEITKLYTENKALFQMVHKETINGKDFIFSHAGLSKTNVEYIFGKDNDINTENIVDRINNAYLADDKTFIHSLRIYSNYRGWSPFSYGSLIWSDIREWVHIKPEDTYGINIVGHTMTNTPIYFKDVIYNLDCYGTDTFFIDEKGVVKSSLNNEIVKETKLN